MLYSSNVKPKSLFLVFRPSSTTISGFLHNFTFSFEKILGLCPQTFSLTEVFFVLSCKIVVVSQGRCSKEWCQVRGGAMCVRLASQTDKWGLNLPY